MVDLSVQIGDVKLSNPVMPASGTFSYDFAEIIDLNRLGAMVAKTVSREYRLGNPTPRMAETEVGIIQSIGLPGDGIQYFLDEMLPEYKKYKPPNQIIKISFIVTARISPNNKPIRSKRMIDRKPIITNPTARVE